MRTLSICLLAVLALPAQAQVPGGTYTLNRSGGDFESFAEAANVLATIGVSGPVVIEVAQATYAERVQLGFIPGASSTNTVTFRGIASGTTLPLVTATPSSSEPFVMYLGKADFVVLETLRFEVADANQSRGTVLRIEADGVVVQDCEIQSIDPDAVSASVDAVGVDVGGTAVVVQDNAIDDGDIGIRYRASPGGSTSGGQILRNDLDDNLSVGILVEDQAVSSGNAVSIRDNAVSQAFSDEAGWAGIWLRDNTGGAVLARNYVFTRSGTGVRVERVTNATSGWTSVVNNAVFGTLFRYDTSAEGIEILDADRVRVLNNTVKIEASPTPSFNTGTALRIGAASTTVRVVNNILVNEGEGPGLDVESLASVTDLDFQVFESQTATGLLRARVAGVDYTDLSAYRAATGDAANTITWAVEFGSIQLRLAGRSDGDGNLIGQPEPGVPFDIDGDARDPARPYRGADEAPTPLVQPPPPLTGLLTIRPDGSGTYASMTEAFEALETRGVGGPVYFLVGPGTFNEQLELGPIPGASATRNVRFVGALSIPVIRADGFSNGDDWMLKLTDVRHVSFERIHFRSQDLQDGNVIWVRGGNDILFGDGCIFESAASGGAVGTLVEVGGPISNGPSRNPRDIRIHDSTFLGGRTAIDISLVDAGGTFGDEGGFEVAGNTILGLHPTFDGIVLGSNARGILRRNLISAPSSGPDFVGIQVGGTSALDQPESPVVVEGNEVVAHDGVGILWESRWLQSPGLYPEGRLEVVNNTVRMAGAGPTVGLQIESGEGELFAHNTVSVASTDASSAAASIDASSGTFPTHLDLRNNIFDAHLGRALDLVVGSTSPRYIYDDNVFWSDGATLATYEVGSRPAVDCADLACIQAASQGTSGSSNQDLNSIVREVAFVDAPAGNLRLDASVSGDQTLAGAPIPEVETDLDGDLRSANRPYRGADEAADMTLTFVDFRIIVYPQGAARTGCGTACVELSTALQDGGHLPLANPYAAPAFDGTANEHDGTEAVTQAELDAMTPITDWVVVGMRETAEGPEVFRGALLLDHRGRVRGLDGDFNLRLPVPNGDYHVAVYHRNHLPLMSLPVALVDEAPTGTTVRLYEAQQVYGGAGAGAPTVYGYVGMVSGDTNADGRVLADDEQAVIEPAIGGAGYLSADTNLDGSVLADDTQAYWSPNVGRETQVPGAASLRPDGDGPASRRTEAERAARPETTRPRRVR